MQAIIMTIITTIKTSTVSSRTEGWRAMDGGNKKEGGYCNPNSERKKTDKRLISFGSGPSVWCKSAIDGVQYKSQL